MQTTKKIGIDITEADGTPLTCGNYFYWDADLSQILMQEAGDFCPDVDFKQKEAKSFETRFHKDTDKGVELCGTSKSIENKRVLIPECDLDKFIAAIDQLHQKSERPGIPEDNRAFMHDFLVPNPLSMKSAWRVTTGFSKRLLVLDFKTAVLRRFGRQFRVERLGDKRQNLPDDPGKSVLHAVRTKDIGT